MENNFFESTFCGTVYSRKEHTDTKNCFIYLIMYKYFYTSIK